MSEVMEAPATEAPAKTRKAPKPLTDVEKQAATLRRDATLLEKYGNTEKAAELKAQADKLAPEKPAVKRVDPLTFLNQEEQKWLINYFGCTTKGFQKIAQVVSAKKLEAIFQAQGN